MNAVETSWRDLIPFTPRSGHAPRISVCLRKQADALSLQYALRAEMLHVRLPPAGLRGRADGLWTHTCFEAFVSAPGMPGYYELNFSPSGQWAIYRFDSYRNGMSPVDVGTPPLLATHRGDEGIQLEATIGLHELGTLRGARTLKLALSAVLEDEGGNLSYWALKHAPAKPDFHHPDGFVLELPL